MQIVFIFQLQNEICQYFYNLYTDIRFYVLFDKYERTSQKNVVHCNFNHSLKSLLEIFNVLVCEKLERNTFEWKMHIFIYKQYTYFEFYHY